MADGFLGRWSKRKLDAKEGRGLEEPESPSPQPSPASGRGSESASAEVSPSPQRGEGRGEGAAAFPQQQPPAEPRPTLDDVHSLTPESDFSRFVRADVSPDVRNSALKKLFADPRYNIQDGLDVYIDDYGKPDPIPEAMLRNMVGSQLLGLFRDEERTDEASAQPRDDAEAPPNASVAQSGTAPADGPSTSSPPAVAPDDDADPDLRLQQDHAAEGGQSGRGTR